jgi:TPR repeat protein
MAGNADIGPDSEPDFARLDAAYAELTRGEASRAIEQLRELEGRGSALAPLYLGHAHLRGNGLSQDIEKAIQFFLLSAKSGNASAKYNLGVVLDRKGEKAESQRWFQSAASEGHGPSLYQMYKAHRATDCDKALAYLQAAAGKHEAFAKRDLLRLACKGQFGLARQIRALLFFPFATLAGVAALARKLYTGEIERL